MSKLISCMRQKFFKQSALFFVLNNKFVERLPKANFFQSSLYASDTYSLASPEKNTGKDEGRSTAASPFSGIIFH